MTPEEVLSIKPKVLTQKQREFYFENGYLLLEKLLSDEWVERLRATTDEMVDRSRGITNSDAVWDLDTGHTAQFPRLRRLSSMNDHHPTYWEYASAKTSPLPDAVADLVGPDVKFHSSKLNYKWPGSGEIVKWHQDIAAWPHTNYSPVTLGVYLCDVPAERGPLTCIASSHRRSPIFEHRDNSGAWTGAIRGSDMATVDLARAEDLTGPAGTVIAINCRTVHGSRANFTDLVRPVALFVYSSADAFAWMPAPTPTSRTGAIVRGTPARMAHLDPTPCPVPPDWSRDRYGSIFTAQRAEVD